MEHPSEGRAASRVTFLDHGHLGDVSAVGHGQVGQVHLRRGHHGGGRAHGGVVKDGRAVALPAAFPPVAVDGGLELAGGAQAPLFTFVRVQVLHIPAGGDGSPGCWAHIVNQSNPSGLFWGLEENQKKLKSSNYNNFINIAPLKTMFTKCSTESQRKTNGRARNQYYILKYI